MSIINSIIPNMSRRPASKTGRVSEPIQVYLTKADRDLLDRVAASTAASRAEVLRRGIRRMAADVLGEQSTALQFLRDMAQADWPSSTPSDVAERHDQYLAEAYGDRHQRE